MSHTITVTSADIEASQSTERVSVGLENYRCSTCPIARAAKRALGRPVYVDGARLITHFISPFSGRCITLNKYPLPPTASQFTLDFDMGRKVEPFTFII